MSNEMPKEIYVWVQSPPNREPYFVADACPFPAAPECTRYIRADLHAAEAKALADRLSRYSPWQDTDHRLVDEQMLNDVDDFLRKQPQ